MWLGGVVHVEEVKGVEVVEVGLVEVAQEKFNIGLNHISGVGCGVDQAAGWEQVRSW